MKALQEMIEWDPSVPQFDLTEGKTVEVKQPESLIQQADAAVAKRDATRATLATTSPQHPALTEFAALLPAQDAALAALKVNARLRADLQAKKAQQGAVTTTLGSDTISTRLKSFVDVVKKNEIGPLTPYARIFYEKYEKDPTHPEAYFREEFAEAFRLWKMDRASLEEQAPALVEWFDKGGHLK
jgi:hypothetical protein